MTPARKTKDFNPKAARLSSHRQKTRKRIFAAFFLLLLLLIGSRLINILTAGVWDGKTRFTVVVRDPTELISFSPGSGQTTVVPLPETLRIELVRGYGTYQLGKIFALDTQEKKNGQLFVGGLSHSLGIPILSWVDRHGDKSPDPAWFSRRIPLLGRVIAGRLSSGLSWRDFLKWLWFVGGSETQTIDLSSGGFVKAQTEPDGRVSLVLNQDRWDQWVRKSLFEETVDDERLTVVVVNSTDHQGLGGEVARQIENLGATVVRVKTEISTSDGCLVQSPKNLEKSQTLRFIKTIFSCRWEEKDTSAQRADIVVIVGEGYWRFVNSKE